MPSGAWADAVSRRLLLCLAPLLAAAGFALWVIVPSYWAFAVGFVLWGARARSAPAPWRRWYTRSSTGSARPTGTPGSWAGPRSAGWWRVMAGDAPWPARCFAAGGYPAVGAASVLACLLCAAAATGLPRAPRHRDAPEDDGRAAGPTTAGRAGRGARGPVRAARRAPARPSSPPIWGALDEYTPLLARDTGVAANAVPTAGADLGPGSRSAGCWPAPGERLDGRGFAVLLAAAALASPRARLTGTRPGSPDRGGLRRLFQLATVLADARLQDRITGPAGPR